MKIAPLSQSCASMSTPKKQGNTIHVNSGSNTTKLFSKSNIDSNRSLQKTYCLSSACFLAFLAVAYGVAALLTTGAKCHPQNFIRVI